MASTYALPMVPANHAHSHERSESQYSAYSNGSAANSSPLRGSGHRHQRSDMSANGQMHGAVRSPYAEYNTQAHEHSHGRSKGRPRGEPDMGRSPPRKHLSANKFGFSPVSPIQETEPILPNLPSS
jgi:zinc transporter 5/7